MLDGYLWLYGHNRFRERGKRLGWLGSGAGTMSTGAVAGAGASGSGVGCVDLAFLARPCANFPRRFKGCVTPGPTSALAEALAFRFALASALLWSSLARILFNSLTIAPQMCSFTDISSEEFTKSLVQSSSTMSATSSSGDEGVVRILRVLCKVR